MYCPYCDKKKKIKRDIEKLKHLRDKLDSLATQEAAIKKNLSEISKQASSAFGSGNTTTLASAMPGYCGGLFNERGSLQQAVGLEIFSLGFKLKDIESQDDTYHKQQQAKGQVTGGI